MRRTGLVMFIALTVFAAVCAPANAHQANAVTTWNANAGEAAVVACLAPTNNPLHESRMYAMTHLAIHDALNAIKRRSRPYAFDATAKRRTSPDAAVAAAARDVLVALLNQLPEPFAGCGVAAARRRRRSRLRGGPRRYSGRSGEDARDRTGAGRRRGHPRPPSRGRVRTPPRCSTPPIHRARPPASIASRPVPILRSPRDGARSPHSCCATALSSTRVRPTP